MSVIKDKEWSGLLKIPDSVLIDSLRKELSEANTEIGKLKSYIDELEYGKRPLKEVIINYYQQHLRIYEKALKNHDNLLKGIKKQKNIIRERYYNLLNNVGAMPNQKPILIQKSEASLLKDLIIAGIAYARENNAYTKSMKYLYWKIRDQIK